MAKSCLQLSMAQGTEPPRYLTFLQATSVVLLPTLFLVSLHIFVPEQGILGSVLLGLILGTLLYLAVRSADPCFDGRASIPRIVALLSPGILLMGSLNPAFQSSLFYVIALLLVCLAFLGGFAPTITDRQDRISFCLVGASLAAVFGFFFITPEMFSPDSYGYYEQSRTILSGHPTINTHRQYVILTDFGISFPYLLPSLIRMVDLLTGLGLYSAVILNLYVAGLTAILLPALTKRCLASSSIGAIGVLFLLVNPHYLGEAMAARSIPMTIFCTLLVVSCLATGRPLSWRRCLVAGLVAGASVMLRFDALVVATTIPLALIVCLKGQPVTKRLGNLIFYGLGVLFVALPWILFSVENFGHLWISDNGGTALLIVPKDTQRFYSEGYEPPTLMTAPMEWLKALIQFKTRYVLTYGLGLCALQGGALFLFVYLAIRGLPRLIPPRPNGPRLPCLFFVTLGVVVLKTITYVLVGYTDPRYHLETWLLVVLSLVWLVKTHLDGAGPPIALLTRVGAGLLLMATLVQVLGAPFLGSLPLLSRVVSPFPFKSSLDSPVLDPEVLRTPKDVQELQRVVQEYSVQPRVLFLSGNPYRFGAYTGIETYSRPNTEDVADPEAFTQITDQFIKPDYVVATEIDESIKERYGLSEVFQQGTLTTYRVTNRASFGSAP